MGNKDTVTKDYMNDERIFADVYNYAVYDGVQEIKPEELHTCDSTEIGMYEAADGKEKTIQLFRDELKQLVMKRDEKVVYMLLGVENQSDVHYAMPVKNMLYDAVDYHTQVRKKASEYEAERIQKKKTLTPEGEVQKNETAYQPNRGEFVTGFYKKDRLIPVITLVIYFGAEKWDGPRTLHEMLMDIPEKFLALIPDYKINLIVPAEMSDEEIGKFHTSLREVMLFIKYSKDKRKLKEVVKQDDHFESLDTNAIRVINTVTGTRFKVEEGESKQNMCKAIDDMIHEAHEEGLEALVSTLRIVVEDFEQALNLVRSNALYANVTEEQVRQFWNK